MIKEIKKIDLQGNETWQEVVVCNRCKKTLEPTDYVYETKWTAWHPVKMESTHAYGFASGSNPVKHICKCCQKEVEDFINGKDKMSTHKLPTFKERVEMSKRNLINEGIEALKELRDSFMCSLETAYAIDEILKERQSVEAE